MQDPGDDLALRLSEVAKPKVSFQRLLGIHVFYRQHNPASRQEKAVAISYILKECLQDVRWKRIYTLSLQSVNSARARARRRFSAFPSPLRWQRSKIEIDDDDEHCTSTTARQRGRARIGKGKDPKTFDQHP
jgi:hypothetical protein